MLSFKATAGTNYYIQVGDEFEDSARWTQAKRHGKTIDAAAAAALRALRQKEMGMQLAEPLRTDEQAWLDAGLG